MWNGKYCPHRTLDLGWQRFLALVEAEFDKLSGLTSNNNSGSNNSNNNINSTILSIVDWMNANGMDSSFANRARLAQQHGITNYTGTAAQNTQLLNLLRNQSSTSTPTPAPITSYYQGKQAGGTSIVNALNAIKVDSSLNHRSKIAKANGISNYTGTAQQNTQMLNLLKQGKLKRP